MQFGHNNQYTPGIDFNNSPEDKNMQAYNNIFKNGPAIFYTAYIDSLEKNKNHGTSFVAKPDFKTNIDPQHALNSLIIENINTRKVKAKLQNGSNEDGLEKLLLKKSIHKPSKDIRRKNEELLQLLNGVKRLKHLISELQNKPDNNDKRKQYQIELAKLNATIKLFKHPDKYPLIKQTYTKINELEQENSYLHANN